MTEIQYHLRHLSAAIIVQAVQDLDLTYYYTEGENKGKVNEEALEAVCSARRFLSSQECKEMCIALGISEKNFRERMKKEGM